MVNAQLSTHLELDEVVVVKHFCNSTTYIFKNDIELHKEFDNHYMNVAYHGCTNHRYNGTRNLDHYQDILS